MSQNDFSIGNQGAGPARTDINNALQALASLSSGNSAPSTTYANQPWYEPDTNTLWIRNEANSAWRRFGYIDQSNGFQLFEGDVRNTGGTVIGYVGEHSQSTWNTGTNTQDRLISPEKLKSAVESHSPTALEFISSTNASGNSTLNFTGFDSSRYDAYQFVLQNIVPATDTVTLRLRTSTNGGSTYDSGSSDYKYNRIDTGALTAGYISLTTADVGSASGEDGVSGVINVLGPHLAKKTQITWQLSQIKNNGDVVQRAGAGARISSADVDAVRFLFSSGNIESGTITMYGMRNG